MPHVLTVSTFDDWRNVAREMLAAEVPPECVLFADRAEPTLFPADDPRPTNPPVSSSSRRVPKPFVVLAEAVACYRDPGRWSRLYRVLWRLTHGESHLLDLAADDDMYWLRRAERAVRRDTHKMHAFVRFRAVGENFIAWHRPDHFIVRRAAPFFARRFPEMRWTILTPDESVSWNGDKLEYGPGVPRTHAPQSDELEPLWAAYYRSTFNPARIKLKAMKKELPVRHWPTLPETAAIADMLAEAPDRVAKMVRHTEGFTDAANLIPTHPTLVTLKDAASRCAACSLCHDGTPATFGDGPANAQIMLVDGHPVGDDERAGQPFIEPTGGVLDAALCEAGLRWNEVYHTHAVKHRPRTDQGVARNADASEVLACRPWLIAELACVRPTVVVCLGATAARAVLGPLFRFAERRGEAVPIAGGATAVATHSPATVNTAARREQLVHHLMLARQLTGNASQASA